MNTTGISALSIDHQPGLSPLGGIVLFTEETPRALSVELQRKAGHALGIRAMLRHAIDSGDMDDLGVLEQVAAELGEELLKLSSLAGQLKAAPVEPMA